MKGINSRLVIPVSSRLTSLVDVVGGSNGRKRTIIIDIFQVQKPFKTEMGRGGGVGGD